MMYCDSCGCLVDSESRGCENARCKKVSVISIPKLKRAIELVVFEHREVVKNDDVLDRAIRNSMCEGYERALKLASELATPGSV